MANIKRFSDRGVVRMRTRLAGWVTLIAVGGTLAGALAPAQAAGPGATFLLSRPAGFGALPLAGDNFSFASANATSADGRFTVFTSAADDLGVIDGFDHIFVRDTTANTTTVLDRAGPGGALANDDSDNASISADATKVCFLSFATNLVTGVGDGRAHVYVVTLSSGAIAVTDRTSSGSLVLGNQSADGICALDQTAKHLVFTSSGRRT